MTPAGWERGAALPHPGLRGTPGGVLAAEDRWTDGQRGCPLPVLQQRP